MGGVLGAITGAALGLASVLVYAQLDETLLTNELAFALATPGAHVVSWAIGWPLEQEAGLVCYALGAVLSGPVLGAVPGAIAGALLASTTSTVTRG